MKVSDQTQSVATQFDFTSDVPKARLQDRGPEISPWPPIFNGSGGGFCGCPNNPLNQLHAFLNPERHHHLPGGPRLAEVISKSKGDE
jgi:hypothetical protein